MTDHLTHFDKAGLAHMVDVGAKSNTKRIALAQGFIKMNQAAFTALEAGNNKKGDVLGIARIAAITATKKTADLIPLCHPISLTHVSVDFNKLDDEKTIEIIVKTETCGQTGVEMEALTGVMGGLLTIYDMLKALDKGIEIFNVRLLEKQGGRSGHYKYIYK